MKNVFVGVFLACILNANAQREIQGTVKEENGFIDFAQVYMQEMEGQILAYTFTDSLGTYRLTFKTDSDSVLLNVSRLGYESLKQIIPSNQKRLDIELFLSKKNQLLEVVVTAGKPIESRGDTISYFVHPFRDGSEKNVEDLLAKLPGISVDEQSGTIKYQGREIKKILLDGDDLTGNNYKVLSKNLSADWLEEVEILKRFTDSRLLQGIRQSDEVAINLKLKEEAKASLFGTVETGGGHTAKYLAEPELLSYLKKLKLFAKAEANNTGIGLESYDLETYTSIQLEYKGFILPQRVIENQLSPPLFLKPERFTFHEGQFFSGSLVTHLSPKTSLRSITTLYNNEINFNLSDSVYYLLPSVGGFSFTQKQRQLQRPFEFFQDIKLENRLASNQDFIVRIQNKYSTSHPLTTNSTDVSAFHDQSDTRENEWFVGASYIRRLNQNWVNSSDLEMGNHRLNERFVLSNRGSLMDSIKQVTKQGFYNIGVFNRLDGVVKDVWFLNLLTGWSQTRGDFTYIPNQLTDGMLGINSYRFDNLYAEFKITRNIKKARVSFSGRLRNAKIEYNNEPSSQAYFEPTVTVSTRKTLGKINTEVKGLYNIEYRFLKPNQLVNTPLLADYRTSISFSSQPHIPVKNEIVILTIKISEDDVSYMSANAEFIFLKSSSILATGLTFANGAVITNQMQGGRSRDFFSTYSVDKYVSGLQTTIKVAYDYNRSFVPLSIEEFLDDSQLQQSILSITSGSFISSQVNLSLAFKITKTANKWNEDKNSFSFKNYFIKIIYKPNQFLRATIDYQGIDFMDTQDFSDIVNASLSYSIIKDRFDAVLTFNNILNRKFVVLSTIEPSILSSSLYSLQPQFLLLSAKYRF